MKANQEFVPLEWFYQVLRYWWLVMLLVILGGIAGFIISRVKPPLYEARAVFMISIDFNKIDFMHPPEPTPAPYKLTQYDEDISLVVVESALRQVVPQLVAYVQQIGIPLDSNRLWGQSTIERKNAYWEVRFRDTDPVIAQKVTNAWAQQALALLKDWQKTGKMPAYLFFDLIQTADLPAHPTYFGTNSLVLAGGVIGMVVALLVSFLPLKFFQKNG